MPIVAGPYYVGGIGIAGLRQTEFCVGFHANRGSTRGNVDLRHPDHPESSHFQDFGGSGRNLVTKSSRTSRLRRCDSTAPRRSSRTESNGTLHTRADFTHSPREGLRTNKRHPSVGAIQTSNASKAVVSTRCHGPTAAVIAPAKQQQPPLASSA